jgi:hypothetical protein
LSGVGWKSSARMISKELARGRIAAELEARGCRQGWEQHESIRLMGTKQPRARASMSRPSCGRSTEAPWINRWRQRRAVHTGQRTNMATVVPCGGELASVNLQWIWAVTWLHYRLNIQTSKFLDSGNVSRRGQGIGPGLGLTCPFYSCVP